MRDVQVSNWSMSGSGGEERMTGNVTFNTDKMRISTLGIHDHKGLQWEMVARILGVDPNDPNWNIDALTSLAEDDEEAKNKLKTTERSVGCTVTFDATIPRSAANPTVLGHSSVFEWGRHVSWSRSSHRAYSTEFKDIVRTVLLCHQRKDNSNRLSAIPRDVLMLIFKRLALHYNANPFDELPAHPDPESLKERPAEENAGGGGGMFW